MRALLALGVGALLVLSGCSVSRSPDPSPSEVARQRAAQARVTTALESCGLSRFGTEDATFAVDLGGTNGATQAEADCLADSLGSSRLRTAIDADGPPVEADRDSTLGLVDLSWTTNAAGQLEIAVAAATFI
jgi:hypothetical protein